MAATLCNSPSSSSTRSNDRCTAHGGGNPSVSLVKDTNRREYERKVTPQRLATSAGPTPAERRRASRSPRPTLGRPPPRLPQSSTHPGSATPEAPAALDPTWVGHPQGFRSPRPTLGRPSLRLPQSSTHPGSAIHGEQNIHQRITTKKNRTMSNIAKRLQKARS